MRGQDRVKCTPSRNSKVPLPGSHYGMDLSVDCAKAVVPKLFAGAGFTSRIASPKP